MGPKEAGKSCLIKRWVRGFYAEGAKVSADVTKRLKRHDAFKLAIRALTAVNSF